MKLLLKASSLFLLLAILFAACGKKGGGTNTQETDIAFSISPDPGSGNASAFSSSYQFSVNIQSTMPPQGVDVTVEYRRDGDNSLIFSQTVSSTSTPINITITNIPDAAAGTVTVRVTSKTKSSNTAVKTFRLVRK